MATTKAERRNAARQEAARTQARRQRLMLIGVGIGIVVLAVLIAALTSRGGDEPDAEPTATAAQLAGSPGVRGSLPTAPDAGATDPAVGQEAPIASGADFDGQPVTIGEPGRGQLVMFVASWCGACQAELPEVVAWLDAGNLPDDVDFTTVVTWLDDTRPNWPPDAWLEREGYTGRVLVDDTDATVAAAYGQPATPYWVVIDSNGDIAARTTGMISADQMSQFAQAVSGG